MAVPDSGGLSLSGLNLTTMFLPDKATDLSGEIACYSLPYGGLGFASHFLTFYTLFCLWDGRSPLWPKHHMRYSVFIKADLCLSAISLVVTTGLVALTIVRCRNSWQLLTMAIWKLSMSLLNGITAVNVSTLVVKEKHRDWDIESRKTALWILLYLPGMIAGLTGLIALVVRHLNDRRLVVLTTVFYLLVGLCLGFYIKVASLCLRASTSDALEAIILSLYWLTMILTILATFYSDWALGIMTDNLLGLPSGDNAALFWTYWLAKRLTMFSW